MRLPVGLIPVLELQGLVTLLVMVGLGIVFGLPYLVARNRRRSAPYSVHVLVVGLSWSSVSCAAWIPRRDSRLLGLQTSDLGYTCAVTG